MILFTMLLGQNQGWINEPHWGFFIYATLLDTLNYHIALKIAKGDNR